jgi:hypothetical protein
MQPTRVQRPGTFESTRGSDSDKHRPRGEPAMTPLQRVSLVLRALVEVGVVVALAYWGVHAGDNAIASIVLAVAAPTVGFGLWDAVDFRRAAHAELLRLIQELAISGLAALAWSAAGQHMLGLALAGVSLGYHALVYACGERLLKPKSELAPSSSRKVSLTP